MIIDLAEPIGAFLNILINAGIYYLIVRFLVFILGLIIKPIYKKRLLPDSKVEETKRKVFKYLYLSLMILITIYTISMCSLSM